jgi:predicted nucleic acid-binding protein
MLNLVLTTKLSKQSRHEFSIKAIKTDGCDTMKSLRIYVDTSVFGGCFDDEFKEASLKLFDEIRAGRFILLFSAATLRELKTAPEQVRGVLRSIPEQFLEAIEETPEVIELRDAYLKAGIVTKKSTVDAEHIAAASVAGADIIVSWNFKHIVHYDKIRGYRAVNLLNRYSHLIAIHSPKEVINNDGQ